MFPLMVVFSAIILNEKKIEEKEEESKLEDEQNNLIKNEETNDFTIDSSYLDKYETRSTVSFGNHNKSNIKEENKNNNPDNLSLLNQLSIFWSFLKTDKIYKPVIFIFLFMITPSYNDIMFFFYTNRLHFTPMAIGRLRLVYGIASILGIYSYNKYLKDISFKKIIFCSTCLASFFSLSSLMLVERINIKLGIPDFIFCMGADALNTALSEINMLPILVLACNICPKNIEGTLYAFLMSVVNLSSLFANQIGSVISYSLGITSQNFTNFRYFILIANFSSCLPLPFLMLINDKDYNNEKQICDPEEEEKKNLLNNGLRNYMENKHNDEMKAQTNNRKDRYNNCERLSHNTTNKNFNYEKLLLKREKDEEKMC